MIDYIKTEAIRDLLVAEFPGHNVTSKLISGQQYYQIKKARTTVAILCVDPDYFSDLLSVEEVRNAVKADEVITPLKKAKETINIVLLAKHDVRMNQSVEAGKRKSRVLLNLLGNWHAAYSVPKFGSKPIPVVSLDLHDGPG
jgi:hypothetical protein